MSISAQFKLGHHPLVINPDYHRDRKRRMEKRKAQRALRQTVDKPKTRAEVAFHRLNESATKM